MLMVPSFKTFFVKDKTKIDEEIMRIDNTFNQLFKQKAFVSNDEFRFYYSTKKNMLLSINVTSRNIQNNCHVVVIKYKRKVEKITLTFQ